MLSPADPVRPARWRVAATLGAIALLLGGCASTDPPPSDSDPDPSAPAVSSTDPNDGATLVELDRSIEITFSEAMAPTATEAAVEASPAIDCDFVWHTETRLTCEPTSGLTASTDYTITIGPEATSQAGRSMATPETVTFTTGTDTMSVCTFGTGEFGRCVFAP